MSGRKCRSRWSSSAARRLDGRRLHRKDRRRTGPRAQRWRAIRPASAGRRICSGPRANRRRARRPGTADHRDCRERGIL
jgi:hypothetical protein